MRKLLTFIVILSGLFVLMDHVPITYTKHLQSSHRLQMTSDVKKSAPAIQAASYEVPPKYTRENGCEQYRQLVSQYNWDSRVMMAVMEAESTWRVSGLHCDSQAVGDDFVIAGVYAVSCGLMQVRTIAPWRGTCDQLKDPEFNVDIAYRVWQGQGYSAWSTYTNGSYLQYIR